MALRYDMHSQGISQLYLHKRVPAKAGAHLPTPEGWKAELALGGWLVAYRNKCPATKNDA